MRPRRRRKGNPAAVTSFPARATSRPDSARASGSETPRHLGGTVPKHVAIIMDGNGRWAKARGLPRAAGHKAGAEAARKVLRAAGGAGVERLTLSAISSENWRRPAGELDQKDTRQHYTH